MSPCTLCDGHMMDDMMDDMIDGWMVGQMRIAM